MAKKKPYRFLLYLIFRFGAGCVYGIPRSLMISVAKGLGVLGYYLIGRQRKKTLQSLRFAYGGEKSEKQIRDTAKKVFQNLAVTAGEILQFPKLNFEKLNRLVDTGNSFEVYDAILKEGHGLISITAHIGNWELLAGAFALSGKYEGIVVGRRIYYEPYNRWIVNIRKAMRVETVYRDEASRELLKRLKANQCVGLLPDQDIDSLPGIFVPFLGRPAYTTIAPVKLSLATGAPMIPIFLIRQPDGRYKVVMGEIIRPEVKSDKDGAIRYYTEVWMKCFEEVIRQYPEQWAWMHSRWKTQETEVQKENYKERLQI